MIKALFGERLADGWVRCRLCGHQCRLAPGQRGICGVRKNVAGELYSLNADRVAAVNIDPIEKKPLYHFLPGSRSFSIAAMGCNFSCRFCQNHTLSQVAAEDDIEGENLPPERLAAMAKKGGCRSISYTYTEPTVFFELVLETAKRARQAGLRNVLVSNGYLGPDALKELGPLLDGANIDLKSFRDRFYHDYCAASLAPVLESIAGLKAMGVWVEVTTLLIPGLNDKRDEIEDLASFLVGVDAAMPWHVSRFFPSHRLLDVAATREAAVHECLRWGSELGLKYVYGGNLPDSPWNDTRCPNCGAELIRRCGYQVDIAGLRAGSCGSCGTAIAGVWQ